MRFAALAAILGVSSAWLRSACLPRTAASPVHLRISARAYGATQQSRSASTSR